MARITDAELVERAGFAERQRLATIESKKAAAHAQLYQELGVDLCLRLKAAGESDPEKVKTIACSIGHSILTTHVPALVSKGMSHEDALRLAFDAAMQEISR